MRVWVGAEAPEAWVKAEESVTSGALDDVLFDDPPPQAIRLKLTATTALAR